MTLFAVGGIVTDLTLENKHMTYHSCRNPGTKLFVIMSIVVYDVPIRFFDKIGPASPLEREHYWNHILKLFAPYSCEDTLKAFNDFRNKQQNV